MYWDFSRGRLDIAIRASHSARTVYFKHRHFDTGTHSWQIRLGKIIVYIVWSK